MAINLRSEVKQALESSFKECVIKMNNQHFIKHSEIVYPNEIGAISQDLKLNGFAEGASSLSKEENKIRQRVIDTIKLTKPHDNLALSKIIKTKAYGDLVKHFEGEDVPTEPAIFTGLKGSGKSSTLNLFTAKMNEAFLSEGEGSNFKLVIRGSAEEFSQLTAWIKQHGPESPNYELSLRDYMMLRTAFTLVKYMDIPVFNHIYSDIKHQNCRVLHSGFRAISGLDGEVKDIVEYIRNQLDIYQNAGEGEGFGLFNLLKDSLRERARGADSKSDKDYYTLSNKIREYCQINNILIIYILDGIDNCYSFNKENKEAYERMVEGVASYFISSREGSPIVRYLIACRPETANKIRNINPKSYDSCPMILFSNSDEEVIEIIDKKQSEFFRELITVIDETNKSDDTYQFVEIIKNSWSEHQKYCIKLLAKAEFTLNTKEDVISELFCGNIRTYLYNFISYATLKLVFIREQGIGLDISPSQEALYRLFIFNLFSGGRHYIETRRATQFGQSNLGALLPNPFIYRYPIYDRPLVANIVDHSLLSVHILSVLNDKKNGIVKEKSEILRVLKETSLQYNESIVDEIYTRFYQFRIIERDEEQSSTFNVDKVSSLGKVLLYILNSDSSIFSWLALDSVYSKPKWINYISLGLDDFCMREEHWRLNLILGIRFLAHLAHINRSLYSKDVTLDIDLLAVLNDMTDAYTGLINADQVSYNNLVDWCNRAMKLNTT